MRGRLWLAVAVCCCVMVYHGTVQAQSAGSEAADCTLYYVWSPRMALSAQHAATPLSVAQQQGLTLRVQHPADISAAEIHSTLKRLRSEHPHSAVFLRDSSPYPANAPASKATGYRVFTHYPAVWIQRADSNATDSSPLTVGMMPGAYWQRVLNQLRRTLNC